MLVPRASRNARPVQTAITLRRYRHYPAAIMVNGRLTRNPSPGRLSRCAIAHRGMTKSLFINCFWIEQDVRVHERQSRPALACVDLAVEARTTAGVARRARLLDPDPDGVLIAIHSHLDDSLSVT